MNKTLQKPLNKLLELYKKYENNDFVLEKISDSICNKLPIETVCWCKEMEKNAKSTKKISFILLNTNTNEQLTINKIALLPDIIDENAKIIYHLLLNFSETINK